MVGINNEAMFEDKEHDIEKLKGFLEEKEAFRYTCFIDNQNHARDSKSRLFFSCALQHLLVTAKSYQEKKRDSQPSLLLFLFIFVQFLGVYNSCGYQGIPCLILLVNNVVSYVGSPGEGFGRALSNSLDAIAMEKEE